MRDSQANDGRRPARGPDLVLLALGCLLLAACCPPGSLKPTIKIGLSAPFEGRDRDLGYEALHAVRLAVRQRNEAGGVAGRYLVEMVALNDLNEPAEAVIQARKMAVDPGVVAVVGGWSPETARAAASEYERLGLAFVVPEADFRQGSPPVETSFSEEYRALSGGAPPGVAAAWAYAAAQRLMDTLEAALRDGGEPSRAAVRAELGGHP